MTSEPRHSVYALVGYSFVVVKNQDVISLDGIEFRKWCILVLYVAIIIIVIVHLSGNLIIQPYIVFFSNERI